MNYFKYYDDVVVTKSGITDDIQVWILSKNGSTHFPHNGKQYELMEMDRFTLRVKYDQFNNRPYLLVANDHPAQLLNAPLVRLFNDIPDDPFTSQTGVMPSMVNFVKTREVRKNKEGKDCLFFTYPFVKNAISLHPQTLQRSINAPSNRGRNP